LYCWKYNFDAQLQATGKASGTATKTTVKNMSSIFHELISNLAGSRMSALPQKNSFVQTKILALQPQSAVRQLLGNYGPNDVSPALLVTDIVDCELAGAETVCATLSLDFGQSSPLFADISQLTVLSTNIHNNTTTTLASSRPTG